MVGHIAQPQCCFRTITAYLAPSACMDDAHVSVKPFGAILKAEGRGQSPHSLSPLFAPWTAWQSPGVCLQQAG